jgi:hypothetical protein
MHLTNSVFPIFTILTCRNGAFNDPMAECLAETLVERANRGAVAVTAASTLSIEGAAEVFANGFYEALVKTNEYRRIGDIMKAGFTNLWQQAPLSSELLFYEVFGDPALVVNPSP